MQYFMDFMDFCTIAVLENLLFACQFVVVSFQQQFKLLSMKVFHLVFAFVLFFQNNGSQACRVHGTIVPERCELDSAHDKCCKCLEVII